MDVWHGADPGIVVFVHNGEKVSNEVIFVFHAPEETGLADPDDLEEEIAEAEEEGEFKAVRVSKTVTVKKK
jgi:hypothetical protein